MAYKFSKGKRGFGDITFEDDADTGIDFEADTIKLETAGNEVLVVAGSLVGIGTSAPDYTLDVAGDIGVNQYIYHNGDGNTFINFTDNRIRLNAGGINFIDLEKDSSTPYPLTINNGGNRINFRVQDRNSNLLLKTDSELYKVNLYYAGNQKLETANTGVNITGNIGVLPRINSVTKNALQGTSTLTAQLRDTSFTGLSNNDFTVSCWYYALDTNSNGLASNSRIVFFGAGEHHNLHLGYPDAQIIYESHSGTKSTATFDTNLEEGNWYHIVAHFDVADLSTGVPRLWVNGVEQSSSGYQGFGAGTTAATIDDVAVYLDDGGAMQDVVFWNKLLSDCEIVEIYNAGNYIDPSTHSAASSIVSWFKLGYEPDFANAGFSAGDTLSGDIDLDDSIGSNSFTLTNENEFSLLARTVTEYANQADASNPGIDVDAKAIRIRHQGTPCSATAVGMQGEIRWDSNYLYICIATDTWKRIALSTW